jgi:peptidoglycan hydrolase-like protein with peptidoglycan-binding domain
MDEIKLGSTGNGVKSIQMALGLTPDGTFGPKTEAAVKEWQTKNGLTPTGVLVESAISGLVNQPTATSSLLQNAGLDGIISQPKENTTVLTNPGGNPEFMDLESLLATTLTPTNEKPAIDLLTQLSTGFSQTSLPAEAGTISSFDQTMASLLQSAGLEGVVPQPRENTTVLTNPGGNLEFMDLDSFEMELEEIRKVRARLATEAASVQPPNQQTFNNTTVNESTTVNDTQTVLPTESITTFLAKEPNIDSGPETGTIESNMMNLSQNSSILNQINPTENSSVNSSQTISNTEKFLNSAMVNESNSQLNTILNNLTATNTNQSEQNELNSQVTSSVNSPMSRVENSQLVTKAEYNQITKPVNPVVSSLDEMNRNVSFKLDGVSENIKTSVSNISSGGQVDNTSMTQIDQSSSVTNQVSELAKITESAKMAEGQPVSMGDDLRDFYLSSIYEMLASGIKVKITY